MRKPRVDATPELLRRIAVLVLFLLLFYLSRRALTEETISTTATPGKASWPAAEYFHDSFWEVYFTRPDRPAAKPGYGGPDEALAQAIRQAQQEVLMAAFDLDAPSLLKALEDAASRGVEVRLVVDTDNLSQEVARRLKTAGIPYVTDDRSGYMHHKFVVIDRSEVWTGSMNFTFNGAYRNNNNLVRLRSHRLAQNYIREFEEMFEQRRFGPRSRPDTPYARLTINGITVENFFLPEEGAAARLVELTRQARRSVYFLAFSFTNDELGEAMIAQHKKGLTVRGVMEASQIGTGSEYERLRRAGVDVRVDGNPYAMHHKVIVWDASIVAFGSYNFSRRAEMVNDENLLIMHDPNLAAAFLAEFEYVYSQAKTSLEFAPVLAVDSRP